MSFRLFIVIIAIALGIYFCIAEPVNNPEGFENEKSDTVTLSTDEKCPNLLVQEDGVITLTNTNEKIVPGVNPMRFNNLEEYVEFIKWQRSNGIKCPVLFLQKTENTQGGTCYTARPDISDPQGGRSVASMSLDELRQKCETNMPMSSGLTGLEDVNDATYFKSGCGNVTGEIALKTGPVDTDIVDATRNDLPYNMNSMPSYDPSSFYQGTVTPMDEMLKKQRNLPESPSAMDNNWAGQEYTRSLIEKGAYDGRKRSLVEKDPYR